MTRPKNKVKFRPFNFYCREDIRRLIKDTAKRLGISQSAVVNEALLRHFELLCKHCGGTGRERVTPVTDANELIQTLEEFIGDEGERAEPEEVPPIPRDKTNPEI